MLILALLQPRSSSRLDATSQSIEGQNAAIRALRDVETQSQLAINADGLFYPRTGPQSPIAYPPHTQLVGVGNTSGGALDDLSSPYYPVASSDSSHAYEQLQHPRLQSRFSETTGSSANHGDQDSFPPLRSRFSATTRSSANHGDQDNLAPLRSHFSATTAGSRDSGTNFSSLIENYANMPQTYGSLSDDQSASSSFGQQMNDPFTPSFTQHPDTFLDFSDTASSHSSAFRDSASYVPQNGLLGQSNPLRQNRSRRRQANPPPSRSYGASRTQQPDLTGTFLELQSNASSSSPAPSGLGSDSRLSRGQDTSSQYRHPFAHGGSSSSSSGMGSSMQPEYSYGYTPNSRFPPYN